MKIPFVIFSQSSNSFEGQLPGEETVKVIRMHWYTMAGTLVVSFAMFIIVIVSFFLISDFGNAANEFGARGLVAFAHAALGLALMFWWYWTFYQITMYLLKVWVITNRRVVSSTQQGLFNRRTVELAIENIQDISVNIDGMFGTFMEFGDIEIQTAGAENKFFFRRIPHPMQIKETLMHSHGRGKHLPHQPNHVPEITRE